MFKFKLPRPVLVALAACAASFALHGVVFADDAADNKALKEQMRIMMQQMQELQKQVQQLQQQQQQQTQQAQQAPPPPVPPAPMQPAQGGVVGPQVAAAAPAEPKFEKFLKGFYGTLDVSLDDATKGIRGLTAYSYSYAGAGPGSGYVNNGPKGTQITGSVGWLGDLSTNKSVLGYRGSHKIPGSDVDFIYQIETQPAITSSPGLNTSYTQQSNVVKGAIGYGDTFVGVSDNLWGKLKIGTTYAPYKKSTDRMNPFSGMLGDYAVVMGNSGGDNRVEFGTRLDHSIWYESPRWFGDTFSMDVLISPGANRTYDNVVQSAGSPDCSGGNTPGSGNLPQNCDDGGFGTAYSADLKFEYGGLYATAAWELHHAVNRNSDGIGSNSPYYGYLVGLGNGVSPLLDWGTYNNYLNEYGLAFVNANGFTPPYASDVADEWAIKGGVQYTFDFGLAVSGIYEYMHRNLPPALEFQNERQRNGLWFAMSQTFSPKDNLSIGWAHAGRTPGDPGGQHNYNPTSNDDTANMYTIAWKHHLIRVCSGTSMRRIP
jgi:predicted porin